MTKINVKKTRRGYCLSVPIEEILRSDEAKRQIKQLKESGLLQKIRQQNEKTIS